MSEDTTPRPVPPPEYLLEKLALIQAAIGTRIPKNGKGIAADGQSFDYVKSEDLLAVVRTLMAENNVLLLPSATGIKRTIVNDSTITAVALTYTFYDADSGESLVFEWRGTGEDPGDKGLYKAITGGLKYFLLNAFLIPTGDDPERPKEDQPPDGHEAESVRNGNGSPSVPQLTELIRLLKSADVPVADREAMRDWVKANTTGGEHGTCFALVRELSSDDTRQVAIDRLRRNIQPAGTPA